MTSPILLKKIIFIRLSLLFSMRAYIVALVTNFYVLNIEKKSIFSIRIEAIDRDSSILIPE
jgi:hypothetical protein